MQSGRNVLESDPGEHVVQCCRECPFFKFELERVKNKTQINRVVYITTFENFRQYGLTDTPCILGVFIKTVQCYSHGATPFPEAQKLINSHTRGASDPYFIPKVGPDAPHPIQVIAR